MRWRNAVLGNHNGVLCFMKEHSHTYPTAFSKVFLWFLYYYFVCILYEWITEICLKVHTRFRKMHILMWPEWWSFSDVGKQGLDFSKTISKRKKKNLIRLSQMFTWVVKKCLNLIFKVNFLCQKLFETFWIFFSLKNISLEEGFLLLKFFENFNFWTTLFSKMVPNFWRSVWTSVRGKSKNYLFLSIFLLKSTHCWLTSTTEVTLAYMILHKNFTPLWKARKVVNGYFGFSYCIDNTTC